MAENSQQGDILKEKMGYVQWMKKEGLPVIEGHGVEDLRKLELAPWPRMGGKGIFINLYGFEGVTGMYVAEIPPRGSLEPERHLYEEVICILDGHGATEVWQEGGRKQVFEWGPYSLFSPPANSWHRLYNGGESPVRLMAVTTAPLILDIFHNLDFVFNCPYQFLDRYAAQEGFFGVGTKRYRHGLQNIWESNFIPDVVEMGIEDQELKGAGVKITQFELTGNSLIGHVSQWPVGRYHKAHYHGPGAVLLGLRSEGYVLLWSKELGTRPYESGHGDEVVEVKWKE
ncbi:MAG: cupin domain-containing protein, partial [Desulfobacterales bacterium]|nr:cupin domain-containing protein [Desulfobacterales bacterium]